MNCDAEEWVYATSDCYRLLCHSTHCDRVVSNVDIGALVTALEDGVQERNETRRQDRRGN
jgi:hypothetical protein